MANLCLQTAVAWHETVRIARTEIPDLAVPTGVFGSRCDRARIDASADNHAELMSCLHAFHRDA